jgi:hypothetical protein
MYTMQVQKTAGICGWPTSPQKKKPSAVYVLAIKVHGRVPLATDVLVSVHFLHI